MTRMKKVLVTAATLVLGGLAVSVALRQAAQFLDPVMTCGEWTKLIGQYNNKQGWERFFIAIQNGTPVPKAVEDGDNDRLLGDCSGGKCVFDPDPCNENATFEYEYELSPLVNGWRLAEVFGPRYLVGGWKKAADVTPGMRFYWSHSTAWQECRNHFSKADCFELFKPFVQFIFDDSTRCENGRWYGPGKGGTEACPTGTIVRLMPKLTYRGAGSEFVDSNKVWEQADLD